MRASVRSFVVGLSGLASIAILRSVIMLSIDDSRTVTVWADIGEAVVVSIAAVIVLAVAFALTRSEGRVEWLLLGVGMMLFALGDITWAWLHLGPSGEVPYPGLPDVFYLADYGFFAAALLIAGARRRLGADVSSAVLISGVAAAAALGAVFFGLVEPLLARGGLAPLELVLSVLYPVADVVLLAAPALFVVIIAYRRRDREMLLPWGSVAAGVTLLALTDTVFAWLNATGGYSAGSAVDYGWMLSMVALAVGASLALDAANSLAASPLATATAPLTGTYGMRDAQPADDDPWNSL